MTEERRHDFSEVTARLGHMETQIAVIEERTTDTKALKKWILSQLVLIISGVAAIAISWSELRTQIETIDVTGIKRNVSTALTVIGDHGTELQSVRDEQLRVREAMDGMVQSASDMANRVDERIMRTTDDRFRRQDFIAIFDPHMEIMDLQLDAIINRLDRIEQEHDIFFHGKRKP